MNFPEQALCSLCGEPISMEDEPTKLCAACLKKFEARETDYLQTPAQFARVWKGKERQA